MISGATTRTNNNTQARLKSSSKTFTNDRIGDYNSKLRVIKFVIHVIGTDITAVGFGDIKATEVSKPRLEPRAKIQSMNYEHHRRKIKVIKICLANAQ